MIGVGSRCAEAAQRNWEVTKEAGGSLKDGARYWGEPNTKAAHKHQTLENKPGALLRAPQYQFSEEPAARTIGKF